MLLATESPELSRREAGECALLAARLLLNLLKATTRTAQRLTAEVAALEG